MKQAATLPQADFRSVRAIDATLMMKVFYVFLGMALLSVAISIGGKFVGRSIALAGHTDDTTIHQIIIGKNLITAPANAIRFERSRSDGPASRLDLYFRWPQLDGYSAEARDAFNNAGNGRSIVFVSIEESMMSRDMSGRFAPIYSSLIVKPGVPGPGDVTLYGFSEKSGYLNEVLAVAGGPQAPFVARCLSGAGAEESLAPCERDIQVGEGLSLSYRFPKELLADWRALDAAIREKAGMMVTVRR